MYFWGHGMDGRDLPLRIALDGNGPTLIAGSQAKAPGPTFAAFRVQDSRNGQALRRIGPPYPPEREDFLFYGRISLGSLDPESSEVFRWDGRLRHSGTLGTHRLRDVLSSIAGLQSWEIEGPAELLDWPIPGDWVLRPGATRADLLKALEPILTDELKRSVRFTPVEVERDVKH